MADCFARPSFQVQRQETSAATGKKINIIRQLEAARTISSSEMKKQDFSGVIRREFRCASH